jgi:hypothetical protein
LHTSFTTSVDLWARSEANELSENVRKWNDSYWAQGVGVYRLDEFSEFSIQTIIFFTVITRHWRFCIAQWFPWHSTNWAEWNFFFDRVILTASNCLEKEENSIKLPVISTTIERFLWRLQSTAKWRGEHSKIRNAYMNNMEYYLFYNSFRVDLYLLSRCEIIVEDLSESSFWIYRNEFIQKSGSI